MNQTIARFVAACALAGAFGAHAKPPPGPTSAASAPASQATARSGSALVEQGHDVESDGTRVHVPAHTAGGSVPAGASARCADGTWSFSAHRRGTCSHHGGVSRWM